MQMLIANTGRTGKQNSIIFDTDMKIWCHGYSAYHDVYIYAEKKGDVTGVINDLIKLGYREVSANEFKYGQQNVTTRPQMKVLSDGDEFFVGGDRHVANGDAHLSGDASYDGYIVYDESGNAWFESDFPEVA